MSQVFKTSLVASLALMVSACTTMHVKPAHINTNKGTSQRICIQSNDRVYAGFLPALRKVIEAEGYQTIMYDDQYELSPSFCDASMTYTARRSWDVMPFLASVQLEVFDLNGNKLGDANYRVSNGLNMTKFQSEETKLMPLIEQLFVQ